MLTFLSQLASSYFATPPKQIILTPNALSLANIASHTDEQTQSAHSFFTTPSPPPPQQQPQQPLAPPKTAATNSLLLLQQPSFSRTAPLLAHPHFTPRETALSPRATQDLISRLDATSPLLPQNLANFITAASLAARVSLRSSAFFIELILESLRYSTTTSLGITRRALISAVGSARAIHYNHDDHNPSQHITSIQPHHSNYLNVLDHYTNVGIYLVHHVFTMAELFSIAGLNLNHSVISAGFETAELSVMMLDSIFGSNESSRALSAIIMLVRRELLHDPRFTPSHSNSLMGLISLTKAITAFACLQLATSRRTTASMKMRVVWDATMVAESVTESKSLIGDIDYQLGIKQGRAHGCRGLPNDISSSQQNNIISDTPSPFPPSTRPSPRQSIHKLSESDKSSLVPDLRSSMTGRTTTRIKLNRFNSASLSASTSQNPSHLVEEREEIEYELTQILTDGQNNLVHLDASKSPYMDLSTPSSNAEELVPEDVRQALYQVKRTSYSRTQSYASELTSLGTSSTLPDHASSSTYQLTTLTTQTMRTRTTTNSTSHSDHIPSAHHSPLNTAINNDNISPAHLICSPQPSYEPYQVNWSADLPPLSDPSSSTPPRSRLIRVTKKHSRSNSQSNQINHQSGERSTSNSVNSRPRRSKSKSMPSSPRQSLFFSQPKLVRRSLTRSKTHSDVNSVFPDDPYSVVYPFQPMVSSSRTPPLSPSVISEESSLQSDEPVIQPDPQHRPLPFGSTISEIHPEDDEDVDDEPGYFGLSDGQRTTTVVPPPFFITPQHSSTSIQTVRTHRVSQSVSPTTQPPSSDFPPQSLVKNLGRFMRYSSAAYGQQFLRIMGIGVDSFNYPNTKKHSANDHAFASHVGLAVDQILLSSFTEPNPVLGNEVLSPLVHYVSIDHDSKAVVLTCRGTLGLSDILVDLTCEYEPITVDGGDPNASYLAHSGMLHSALRLRRESSTVHEVIKQALIDYPSYGLVITGHSLGGGVAALLAVLCSTRTESFLAQIDRQSTSIAHPPISTKFVTSFRSGFPPGRPIHSYTYGTPAVASVDLSEYTKGLVTTVCNGIDLVPTLSLGVLHDFKSIAVSLHEEESVAIEIVKKVVGLYRPSHGPSWMKSSSGAASAQQASELFEADEAERVKEKVTMNSQEMRSGVGENRATGWNYRDPALEGPLFGKAETTPELGDWLWSLRRTMRAVSDAEKLYPPGEVWHVESYEVFVERDDEASTAATNDSSSGSSSTSRPASSAPKTTTPRNFSSSWKFRLSSSNNNTSSSSSSSSASQASAGPSSRREGRRIILRACDDVQARFSEPIFGKTMFHDHIPSQYELVLELLEAATAPTHLAT
ncbi:hypothetical protein PCANC_07359 [Puccinia coronata f. sp. avenae]|uniref:sn-1-specific diacylglycerol lipase n=1 Tax=Puccinia coronata f. sp. avenae TaxID=200324 RepID=A0A2N5T5E5_9BASI|nr:hypothetical protein PCANC_07359 [Puccinia coronata f. sp. avenae]